MVEEVSIVLFEYKSSLNYSQRDIPVYLKDLSLSYNIHLPLDLPWERSPSLVMDIIERLMEKVQFLHPSFYVLHPPPSLGHLEYLYSHFLKRGYPLSLIYLENTKENSLIDILEEINHFGFKVCLDIGHVLEYHQHNLLSYPGLYPITGAIHIYGPRGGIHSSLGELTKRDIEVVRWVIQRLSPKTTVVVEVFKERDLKESLHILEEWINQRP